MKNDTEYAIKVLVKVLQEKNLLHLFFGISQAFLPVVGSLSKLPVHKYGLSIHNPVTLVPEKYKSLLHAICKLIGAVTGEMGFSTSGHIWTVEEERRERK